MEFLSTNIKNCLAILDTHFVDLEEDIDLLSHRLISTHKLEEKLLIATKCVDLCEKFHSYFHFEQSYFHLLLAKLYLERDEKDDAIKQLEKSLFQDHLNHEALDLLIKYYNETQDNDELEKYKNHASSYMVKIGRTEVYSRNFSDFEGFLKFALSDPVFNEPESQSYWVMYEKYLKSPSVDHLIKTIDIISKNHALYHNNAARIYYNRHLIFQELGDIGLAKNDMIKSKNLDPEL